jgi:hypothetical protein
MNLETQTRDVELTLGRMVGDLADQMTDRTAPG